MPFAQLPRLRNDHQAAGSASALLLPDPVEQRRRIRRVEEGEGVDRLGRCVESPDLKAPFTTTPAASRRSSRSGTTKPENLVRDAVGLGDGTIVGDWNRLGC